MHECHPIRSFVATSWFEMNVNAKTSRERVYAIVRQIPGGKVMTYGQLAIILDEGYTARTVGHVMHGADDDVPWQRVINSQGKCSTGRLTIPLNLQQALLEAEGVIFNSKGKCSLETYQWHPHGYDPDDDDQHTLFAPDAAESIAASRVFRQLL